MIVRFVVHVSIFGVVDTSKLKYAAAYFKQVMLYSEMYFICRVI